MPVNVVLCKVFFAHSFEDYREWNIANNGRYIKLYLAHWYNIDIKPYFLHVILSGGKSTCVYCFSSVSSQIICVFAARQGTLCQCLERAGIWGVCELVDNKDFSCKDRPFLCACLSADYSAEYFSTATFFLVFSSVWVMNQHMQYFVSFRCCFFIKNNHKWKGTVFGSFKMMFFQVFFYSSLWL